MSMFQGCDGLREPSGEIPKTCVRHLYKPHCSDLVRSVCVKRFIKRRPNRDLHARTDQHSNLVIDVISASVGSQ